MIEDGGQRIVSCNGAMLADPAILGNLPDIAGPGAVAPSIAGPGRVARGIAGTGIAAPGAFVPSIAESGTAAPEIAGPGAIAPRIAGSGIAAPDGAALTRLFEPKFWAERGELADATRGRGSAWFVGARPHQWVLRHFRRGGFIARISNDRYVWTGEKRVRAFAEWRLLANLAARGLPVPKPIAARYDRVGIFYRCDLITQRIADAHPLSSMLELAPLTDGTWRDVGATVARFHAAGADHADLNAHNILLDRRGAVSIIDFDRGKLRSPGAWTSGNISRLQRSLVKISRNLPPDRFSAAAWAAFLTGYTSVPVSILAK